MDIDYYKKYEPIFNSWYIKRLIGEGSFGQVYEIERNELGVTYRAALKTLTIPHSQSEVKDIMAEGMSKSDVTDYYKGVVQEIINEFIIMSKLKGNSNIVSYEDHMLIEHEDGIGWDILIRMELLTPLFDYIMENQMTRRDVIKLGIDLCKALELCQKYNIIHRDVKPENIFVSPSGSFKLGDFGIARTVEKTSSGMSRKGTYTYMAPEIYRGEVYGSTVDIYSLGIVMYRLLNDNRTPFLPSYPQPIRFSDKEDALIHRMSGEKIPAPSNADGRLQEIVLKACAFDVNERYSSAVQMRMELESILYEKEEASLIYPDGDSAPIKSLDYVSDVSLVTSDKLEKDLTMTMVEEPNDGIDSTSVYGDIDISTVVNYDDEDVTEQGKVKNAFSAKVVAVVIAILLLVGVLVFGRYLNEIIPNEVTNITGIEDEIEIYIGETYKPEYAIEPVELAEEPISLISAAPQIIDINDGGEITAKALGDTEMSISAMNYSKTVKVHVIPKVTEISNVKSKIKIEKGKSKTLKPVLLPEKFTDEEISYTIADDTIATVDEKGRVKAKKKGTTELIISAGGCEKKITISVFVSKKKTSESQSSSLSNNTSTYVPPTPSESEEGYWE